MIPTAFLCVALAAALGAPLRAHAQTKHDDGPSARTLAEADVIRLVHARHPGIRLANATAEVAAAQVEGTGLYPDPRLQWQYQYVPLDGGERQQQLAISVPVAVSGRRTAERSLAVSNHAQQGAGAALSRNSTTARALVVFYAAIHAEAEWRVREEAVTRLRQGASVLGHRADVGTASGYDRMRVELELELAQSALRQAEARAKRLKLQLADSLGLSPEPLVLRGELLPQAQPAEPSSKERPSANDLARAVEHAERARDEASDSWLPDLQLRGGVILVDTPTTTTDLGYQAGVAMDVPLFERGQGTRARARAAVERAHAITAERAWVATRDERDASLLLSSSSAELARFEAGTGPLLTRLSRATQSGYREGVLGVVELLDVQRAETRTALQRLSLQRAVRSAELAIRAAKGAFE